MTMKLKEVYKRFPSQRKCIEFLEEAIWENSPSCPYCTSKYVTGFKNEDRYHCNKCNTSFGVTVGTIFHRTRCDLQKWFLAIILTQENKISSRQLGDLLEVTKDTAWLMTNKIAANKIFASHIFSKLSKQIKTV